MAGRFSTERNRGSSTASYRDASARRAELAPKLTPQSVARYSPQTAQRFAAAALATVAGLVPARLAFFWTVSPRGEVGDGVLAEHGAGEADSAFYTARVRAIDPFAPRHVAGTDAVLRTVHDDHPTLFGRSPYGRALAAAGLRDQASLYLRAAGAVVGTLALFRARDEAPFGASDLRALRTLHAVLEEGYAAALHVQSTAGPAPVLPALTRREAEVAALIALGASNADIAAALTVELTTVKTHLTQIYAKFGVRSRTQLALLLREQELPRAGAGDAAA